MNDLKWLLRFLFFVKMWFALSDVCLNVQLFLDSLKKAYITGENLIIDITSLIESDLFDFLSAMKDFSPDKLSKSIIIHRTKPEKSCVDLINILKKV